MKNFQLKARIIAQYESQMNFARILGISEDRLSKMIHGRVRPRQAERDLICRELGVGPEIFPAD